MTPQKTPEAIATDAMTGLAPGYPVDPEVVRELIATVIEADRAERPIPVLIIRDGETYHGDDVEVVDLDFLDDATPHSFYDQAGIDELVGNLTAGGFDSAADDVTEWWANR